MASILSYDKKDAINDAALDIAGVLLDNDLDDLSRLHVFVAALKTQIDYINFRYDLVPKSKSEVHDNLIKMFEEFAESLTKDGE